MKSRTNTAPIVRQPVWRAHVWVLSLFARVMTLAARVLYFPSVGDDIVQAWARTRSALDVRIGAKLEMVSGFADTASLICALDISKTLRTREHLVTRGVLAPPLPALFNP